MQLCSATTVALAIALLDLASACGSHGNDHDYSHLRHRRVLQDVRLDLSLDTEMECGAPTPTLGDKFEMGNAMEGWRRRHRGRDLSGTSYTISTYIHVIQKDATTGTLSPESQHGYMTTLNEGFEATPFRFQLDGVTATIAPDSYDCQMGTNEIDMKRQLRVHGSNVLNIFVCNTYAGGVSGWSYYPLAAKKYPDYDSVAVMNPDVSGQHLSNYYSLVHEAGHWLGLFHTFEDGCSSGKEAQWGSQFYYMNSDGVTDTPAHARPTSQEAGKATCWKMTPALNTCPDNVPGVDPGSDPVDNIMNYSSGTCRQASSRLFTPGQIERMIAEYETYRHVKPTTAPTMAPTRTPTTNAPTRPPTARPTARRTQRPTSRPTQRSADGPTAKPTVLSDQASAQCLVTNEVCKTKNSACCGGTVCIGRKKRGRCKKCRRQQQSCLRTTDCCGNLTCQRSDSGKVCV